MMKRHFQKSVTACLAMAALCSSLPAAALTPEEITALNQQHLERIVSERQARRAALLAGETDLPEVTRDTAHPTVRAYLNTPEAQAAANARAAAAVAERQARRAAVIAQSQAVNPGPFVAGPSASPSPFTTGPVASASAPSSEPASTSTGITAGPGPAVNPSPFTAGPVQVSLSEDVKIDTQAKALYQQTFGR